MRDVHASAKSMLFFVQKSQRSALNFMTAIEIAASQHHMGKRNEINSVFGNLTL